MAAAGAAARRRGWRWRVRCDDSAWHSNDGGARVAATARARASHSPSARRPAARASASAAAAAVGGRAGEAARPPRHAFAAPATRRPPSSQQPRWLKAHWRLAAAAAAAAAATGVEEAEEKAQALADARRRGRALSAGGGGRPPHAASAPHWDNGYGRSGIARRHSVSSAGVDGTAFRAGTASWPSAAPAPRVRFLSASPPPLPPRAAPPPARPPSRAPPPAAVASCGKGGSRGGPTLVAVASALAALRTLRARARAAPGRSPYEPSTADHQRVGGGSLSRAAPVRCRFWRPFRCGVGRKRRRVGGMRRWEERGARCESPLPAKMGPSWQCKE